MRNLLRKCRASISTLRLRINNFANDTEECAAAYAGATTESPATISSRKAESSWMLKKTYGLFVLIAIGLSMMAIGILKKD